MSHRSGSRRDWRLLYAPPSLAHGPGRRERAPINSLGDSPDRRPGGDPRWETRCRRQRLASLKLASGASTLLARFPVGPLQHITAGQGRDAAENRPGFVVATGVAAKSVDEAAALGSEVGPTTAHGVERVADAGATRGGVLSEDQILLVRGYGQPLTQADGESGRQADEHEHELLDVLDSQILPYIEAGQTLAGLTASVGQRILTKSLLDGDGQRFLAGAGLKP